MTGEEYKQFCEFLDSQVFSVHDQLLVDKENYKMYFKKFYNYMKAGFELPEVRKHPIKFRFSSDEHETFREMEIRHMIINMIFWRSFINIDKVEEVGPQHIIDGYQVTGSFVKSWINDNIITPYRAHYSNKKLNRIVERIIYNLSKISQDFNTIMGMGFNIKSFIDVAKVNPRFNEIIHTKLEPGMQPNEIEALQFSLMNEEIQILKNTPNCLQPMLRTGVGIKDKQLAEFSITGGLKPDVYGNTIPIPINTNFLVGGLNNVKNYYVDSQAGRKSVILNKTSMGTSGFFSAKCMLVSSGVELSKSTKEEINKHHHTDVNHHCNTQRLLAFDIKSEKYLRKINRRYYYFTPDMSDRMKCINYKKDKNLIGKTIYMRSPITCMGEDGICAACYGDLIYTNCEKDFSIGAYASTQLNNEIEQKILSTKHLLTTVSEKLEFPPIFDRFFTLDASKFKLNEDSPEDFEKWAIRIKNDDLYSFDKVENGDFNSSTDIMYLINKKTKESYEIKEVKSGLAMYIYSDVLDMFVENKQEDCIELPLSKLDGETYIAIIVIENNELTRPLKNIMRLLDRKGHFDCETIDQLLNKMADLLVESGHGLDLIHAECIIRSLIRNPNNILDRPNFSDPNEMDNYDILTVSSALLNNPSLTVSLSFQDLGKQVVNPDTYRKYLPSSYDDLYREMLK